jgi:tyrosine-protein kinase Etk/Wzc
MSNNIVPSNKLIESKDLVFLWRIIKKNLAILILIPLFAYAIGYVYTYRLTDIYGAKAQLLLKSEKTYDYQDPIYKGLGAYGMYMDVKNQIRVLQSRDLIGRVVDKLDVDVSYFIVGRIRKSEVYGTFPFEAEPVIYDQTKSFNITLSVKVLDVNSYELSVPDGENAKTYQGKFGTFLNTTNFGITLRKNYDFKEDNLSHLNESLYEIVLRSKDYMINYFLSRMSVENLEYTSILEIKETDEIAARGKMFLDTLSSVFIEHSKKTQLEVNRNTVENIDKQIDEVKNMLLSIEGELLRYKDEKDIINLSEEEEEYIELYFKHSEEEILLRDKLTSTELLESYINQSQDEHFLPPSFYILEGDFYLGLKVPEYYNLQLKISDKGVNVSPEHPDMQKMEADLTVIKKDILTYIHNLQTYFISKIDSNSAIIEGFKEELQLIPMQLQGIDNIKRELDVNNKMYLFLLEKRTNTLIARAGIIPQVEIVESASSMGLIGPEREKIRKLFALGGIILALLAAFMRNLFFERIENVAELEEATNLSVVGGIPYLKEMINPIIVDKQPKAQVTECFRVLRSNLNFMGDPEVTSRVIMISSFFPGEGKTFCSTNLAMILARSEKKVLLVDFDLHKPRVHKSYELGNEMGISNYLVDNKSFEEIIHKELFPNLDIITSGPIPPNPSELLLRKKMKEFEVLVREEYDVIIFDTPPFGLLNDAVTLAAHSDIFLAVVNSKFARKRGIENVEKVLSNTASISQGLVLNGVRQNRFNYYYSKYAYKYSYRYSYSVGYGYGYGYGQGYGDDSQEEDQDSNND